MSVADERVEAPNGINVPYQQIPLQNAFSLDPLLARLLYGVLHYMLLHLMLGNTVGGFLFIYGWSTLSVRR